MAAQLADLEDERVALVTWIRAEGHEPTDRVVFTQTEKQARWNRYPAILLEIENLRNRYASASLRSMAESSERLRKSSLRLEQFAVGLLILTGVLAVVGTGSYLLQAEIAIGLSGKAAFLWATAGIVAVVVLIIISFRRLKKRYANPTTVNKGSSPPLTKSMISTVIDKKYRIPFNRAFVLICGFALLVIGTLASGGNTVSLVAFDALGFTLIFGAVASIEVHYVSWQIEQTRNDFGSGLMQIRDEIKRSGQSQQ